MRRYTPYIVILLLVLIFAIGPFGVETADAFLGFFQNPMQSLLKGLAIVALSTSAFILNLSGLLLNESVRIAVTQMSQIVGGIQAIQIGWATIRDLINILFIFGLVYIAIATILQLSSANTKRMLAHLVIAALLINFSMFFTKAIVDASNILTTEFYKGITVRDASGTKEFGISEAFMSTFNLSSLYKTASDAQQAGTTIASGRVFLVGILGSVVMLIATFIFLAAAVLFMIRFGILIILMITSPFAFASMVFPQIPSKMWWSALWDQVLFAPVYMILTWISVQIITHPSFKTTIAGNQTDMAAVLTSTEPLGNEILVFLNFFVVVVFLVASLIIAKKIGAFGASGFVNAGGKIANRVRTGAQGLAGRNTIGWLSGGANRLTEKFEGSMRKTKAGRFGLGALKTVGAPVYGTLTAAAQAGEKAKFGSGKSRFDVRVTAKREAAKEIEESAKDAAARTAAKNKADIEAATAGSGDMAAIKTVIDRMSPDQVKDLSGDALAHVDETSGKGTVSSLFTPAHLEAIQRKNSLTTEQRAVVSQAVQDKAATDQKMARYLATPAGSVW